MTREIKVGLVVSCSFLCLVGVVVTTKIREKKQAALAANLSPLMTVSGPPGAGAENQSPPSAPPASPRSEGLPLEIKPFGPAPTPEIKPLGPAASPEIKPLGPPTNPEIKPLGPPSAPEIKPAPLPPAVPEIKPAAPPSAPEIKPIGPAPAVEPIKPFSPAAVPEIKPTGPAPAPEVKPSEPPVAPEVKPVGIVPPGDIKSPSPPPAPEVKPAVPEPKPTAPPAVPEATPVGPASTMEIKPSEAPPQPEVKPIGLGQEPPLGPKPVVEASQLKEDGKPVPLAVPGPGPAPATKPDVPPVASLPAAPEPRSVVAAPLAPEVKPQALPMNSERDTGPRPIAAVPLTNPDKVSGTPTPSQPIQPVTSGDPSRSEFIPATLDRPGAIRATPVPPDKLDSVPKLAPPSVAPPIQPPSTPIKAVPAVPSVVESAPPPVAADSRGVVVTGPPMPVTGSRPAEAVAPPPAQPDSSGGFMSLPGRQTQPEAPANKGAVYQEKQQMIQDGDTYLTLARNFYGSEDYAVALQRWNMIHEQASATAQKGRLVIGEKVYFPSREMLERTYPEALPAVRPTGAVEMAPQTARPAPEATLQYRVGGQGEPLYAIATKTLKDPTRWSEIARLNPTLNPENPVPANTVLRLPAGATVPAENKP
jgi:hypothetical protein